MKLLYALLAILMFCSIATASMEDLQPYTIRVIIWDIDGNREINIPVTFTYNEQSKILYSADDGTMAFSLLNFDNVSNKSHINVSCKYGAKNIPVNYECGATGVTFNEPSEEAAISVWTTLGFIVTSIGGGIYYLSRKKKGGNK